MMLSQNAVQLHNNLLNDRTRSAAFLNSIGSVVSPGDVVVDIGTGTGILAMAAVRAGAKRVYAIEPGRVGAVAKKLFETNGMTDRITLIRGISTEVDLPERADVVLCELIGNEPLAEKVLDVMGDALRRFLRSRGRLLPSSLKVFGVPVTIPKAERRKLIFTPEAVMDWQSWYGFDFRPLLNVNRNSLSRFYINSNLLRGWRSLSAPVRLFNIDFLRASKKLEIKSKKTVTATASGRMDGLVMYFELELVTSKSLSTKPSVVKKDNHWEVPIWILNEPWSFRIGDRFEITYLYDAVEHEARCELSLAK